MLSYEEYRQARIDLYVLRKAAPGLVEILDVLDEMLKFFPCEESDYAYKLIKLLGREDP